MVHSFESLRDQFGRMLSHNGDLYHCYVFPPPGAEGQFIADYDAKSLLKLPVYEAIAKAASPLGADATQIIEAGGQGGPLGLSPGGSIYFSSTDATRSEARHTLATFRAMCKAGTDTLGGDQLASISLLVPGCGRMFSAAGCVTSTQHDGSLKDRGGHTGFTNSELRWLDHLYGTLRPPRFSNVGIDQVQYTVMALPCNLFQASLMALGQQAGDTNLISVTKGELARRYHVTVKTISRWMESGKLSTQKQPGTSKYLIDADTLPALPKL